MQENNNGIEAKQMYLRSEIIDKNYDPEEFTKYINILKGEDGFDWETWTMSEWEEVVEGFKQSQEPQTGNDNNNVNEEYINSYDEKNFVVEDTKSEDKRGSANNKVKVEFFASTGNNVVKDDETKPEDEGEKGDKYNTIDFPKLEGEHINNNNNNNIKLEKEEEDQRSNDVNNTDAVDKIQNQDNDQDKINDPETGDKSVNKVEETLDLKTDNIKWTNNYHNDGAKLTNPVSILNLNWSAINEKEYPWDNFQIPETQSFENMLLNNLNTSHEKKLKNKEALYHCNADEIIYCLKQEKYRLTDMSKLTVRIENPEWIKNGWFSFSYYQVTLKSTELNTAITRKMSDFDWFRQKIVQMYPSVYITPLPQSKLFQNKSWDKNRKKVYYLQKFMNNIIKTKLIRSSQIFYDFITLEKEEFKKARQTYDKIQSPKAWSQVTTIEGWLNVSITPYTDTKGKNIQNDINKKVEAFNRLNLSLKDLQAEMLIMSKKLDIVSTHFNNWSNLYANSWAIDNDRLVSGFSALTKWFGEWSNGYKLQNKFVDKQIRYFFKCMKKELVGYNTVCETFNSARNTYMDWKNKSSRNEKEWQTVKKYYGFYMNKAVGEYERWHNGQFKRLKKHFENWEEDKGEYISDYINFIKIVCFNL